MSLTILAIGPRHDPLLAPAIAEYMQRLRPPYDVTWRLLAYDSHDETAARRAESASLLAKIDARHFVVLLDERGSQLSSEALAATLEAKLTRNVPVVFVIGGAYGVDDTVRQRADLVLSLSALIFPHQLVRLILIEQLYRVQAIVGGHPYHHKWHCIDKM